MWNCKPTKQRNLPINWMQHIHPINRQRPLDRPGIVTNPESVDDRTMLFKFSESVMLFYVCKIRTSTKKLSIGGIKWMPPANNSTSVLQRNSKTITTAIHSLSGVPILRHIHRIPTTSSTKNFIRSHRLRDEVRVIRPNIISFHFHLLWINKFRYPDKLVLAVLSLSLLYAVLTSASAFYVSVIKGRDSICITTLFPIGSEKTAQHPNNYNIFRILIRQINLFSIFIHFQGFCFHNMYLYRYSLRSFVAKDICEGDVRSYVATSTTKLTQIINNNIIEQ